MITSVDHINIVVTNLDRSVSFYTKILGFREIKRATLEGEWIDSVVGLKGVRGSVAYIVAPGGEPRIELLHYQSPKSTSIPETSIPNTPGLRHIAFRVKDIQDAVEKLTREGIKIQYPPVSVPSSVVKHDQGQKSLCYFYDPDGTLLELAEYS